MDITAAFIGKVFFSIAFEFLKKLWWPLSRFVISPVRKLVFPAVDQRSGIKQSRMRYYRIEFRWGNEKTIVYQEIDSNGILKRYVSASGARFLPPERHEASIVAAGKFQFPPWGKVDWSDVFNGDMKSGRWAISDP